MDSHREVIEHLHDLFENDDRFQHIYRDFEQQKICYIPIGMLALKPLHRLLHYQLVLERKSTEQRLLRLSTKHLFCYSF